MSFDIFLQRFRAGDAAPADATLIRTLLGPYVSERPPGSVTLRLTDGEADLYGWDDLATAFMVNHVSGEQAYDVLFEVALRAGLAIMPVGCPTAVTSEETVADLPTELAGDVVVVRSGAELLSSITTP